MKKRYLSMLILAALLLFFGVSGRPVYAGDGLSNCGDNLGAQVGGDPVELDIYRLDSSVQDYTSNAMSNLYYGEDLDAFPWADWRNRIQAINIGKGVRTIAGDAFRNMPSLTEVTLPRSISYIAENAFLQSGTLRDVYWNGTQEDWDELAVYSISGGNEPLLNANLHCYGFKDFSIDLTMGDVDLVDIYGFEKANAFYTTIRYGYQPFMSSEYDSCFDLDMDGNGDIGFDFVDPTCIMAGTMSNCSVAEWTFYSDPDQRDYDNGTYYCENVSIVLKPDVLYADITLNPPYCTYNGKEQKPEPTVKLFGKTLVKGTDYTVTYFDNINVGWGAIRIAGIGKYAGVSQKNFEIRAAGNPTGISLDASSIEIPAEMMHLLTATVTPKQGVDKTVTFKSSDPSIASVDANGMVTAYKMGRVTITATTVNGKKATCAVRVLFKDVTNKNSAAYPAVYALADQGVVAGYGSYFDVDGNCTRAQFVLFLWRLAGKPNPKSTNLPFKDKAAITALGGSYPKAVAWGVEKGIVAGFTSGPNAGKFCPNDPCTRGQVVLFLWRYKGKPAASAAITFKDAATINAMAPDYKKAITWAVAKKLTTGFSDGTFRPNANCTRGQCVTFIYRLPK